MMPTNRSQTNQYHSKINAVLTGKTRHALLHGDCLNELRRLPDECVDSIITDPPYGISYRGLEDRKKPIANDEHPFIWWLYDAYRLLKPGGAVLCFCPWKKQQEFRLAIETAGLAIRSHVIWDRMNGGMGATHCTFAPRHDVIWFAVKGRFHFPNGRPDSVLGVPNVPAKRREHSTQKPDQLMQRLIDVVTPKGGTVLDPCMGSGSTIVAALQTGRRGIGIELDLDNYATACRRCSEAVMPGKYRTKGKSVPMRQIRIGGEVLCA